MSIKGLNNIIKQREQQYGALIGEKINDDTKLELEEIKQAISTLAENQKNIYMKLEEISDKFGDK